MAATATSVEAAAVVITCYTPLSSTFNFVVPNRIPVQLQAYTGTGYDGYVRIDSAVLNADGCASWVVPVAYRAYYLRTYIESNQDFFKYQGSSTGNTWALSVQWVNFPYANGHAYPGDDGQFWYLGGTVSCSGCNLNGFNGYDTNGPARFEAAGSASTEIAPTGPDANQP
jgi:hypothetical protein